MIHSFEDGFWVTKAIARAFHTTYICIACIASSYGNQSTEPMIGDLLLHVLGDLQKVRFTEKIINNTTSTGTKLHGQKQEIVPASKKPPNILKQMHCYQLRNEKKPCKPLHFLNSFTNSTCRAASHLSHFLHIIWAPLPPEPLTMLELSDLPCWSHWEPSAESAGLLASAENRMVKLLLKEQ